jgi:hypothetical protein
MNATDGSWVQAIRGPITLITLGALFVLNNFTGYGFDKTWPVLLIVFGLLSLLKRSMAPPPAPAPPVHPFPPPSYTYTPPNPPPPPAVGGYSGSSYAQPGPPAKGGFGASAPARPAEPGEANPPSGGAA